MRSWQKLNLEEKYSVAIELKDTKAEADDQNKDALKGVEELEDQDALLVVALVSKH